MASYSITIEGDKELADKLRKYGASILDLSKSMGNIGDYLTAFFSGEVFASRGSVISERWPRLNENYAVWKAGRWPGAIPLVRTGLMQRGFKHKSTRLTTSLWNEAAYFDYHQEGLGVPQRMMMKVDTQRERRIVTFIEDDLTGKQRALNV
ncbi:hypothetical protein [Arthrobacter sp. KNU40]|uniref:hypothetical protein n=1 Tax=Arthrobacter sp. KNU40 TaxID=3447965 RepID=UPI003F6147B2